MKYRRRPDIIEANKYHKGQDCKGVCFCGEGVAHVHTIHGTTHPVEDGDYICQEPDGLHYYPCKPDVFENRHDPCQD